MEKPKTTTKDLSELKAILDAKNKAANDKKIIKK